MSRFGAKTYSRREIKSNLQFDQLLSDNKNKPSTAKVSVASVQRWGVASFTSIRKAKPPPSEGNPSGKRKRTVVKTEKASKVVEPPDRANSAQFCDDPFSFESDVRTAERRPPSNVSAAPVPVVPTPKSSSGSKRPNKFFKSREIRPLSAQNSPKPPQGKDSGYKSSSDIKFKQLALETFPSNKNVDYGKSRQENARYVQQKPGENIDLLCLQNLDPTEEHSPAHSDNSPLPDYFGLPERGEDPYLLKNSQKLYGLPDYPGEFDSLLLSQSDKSGEHRTGSPEPAPSQRVPQTRTYTRSQKRAEVSRTDSSSRPTGALPEDCFNPPRSMLPKTWSESVGLGSGSQGLDGRGLELSQESKGSQPSLTDSQQSNSENEFGDHQTLKSHHSGLRSRRIFNSPKLKKATYKHRPWQAEEPEETDRSSEQTLKKKYGDDFEVDEMGRGVVFDGHKLTLHKEVRPSRNSGETVTSWTCQRKVKELYTVVHNVKQAYQCHESGETQEFNDDVEYLLEGIQQTSSLGTRCLSTLGWASKCMVPSFRIHVRAHGTMSSVYSALADAPKEPSLSLCVSTLMFVLSQDRLTMDLEARSLSLMLQLLDTSETMDTSSPGLSQQDFISQGDSQTSTMSSSSNLNDSISAPQNGKVMEKVRHLCEVMKQNGYAKQLDLNNITTGNLAMETLLSMTSRKAGEWFKEEIRSLGGLDYIVHAVQTCVELCGDDNTTVLTHPTDEELDLLRKVDRCLRVLENVSYSNSDNQHYLLEYKQNSLLKSCVWLLRVCIGSLLHCSSSGDTTLGGPEAPVAYVRRRDGPAGVFIACIFSLLKVLINLTNENRHGSQLAGMQDWLLEYMLVCVLQTPQKVPQDERFDLLVLALGLLINLMEGCEGNRHRFVVLKTMGSFDCQNNGFELSSMEALVEVFLNRCELARQCEEHTDALLDGQEASNKGQGSPSKRDQEGSSSLASSSGSGNQGPISHQSKAEEMEETLMKALQKAGKNMEHTMIAAYIALLLGCIIQTNEYADLVRVHLPDETFKIMVDILRKFLNFINLTGSISTTGVKSIQRVLGILEAS